MGKGASAMHLAEKQANRTDPLCFSPYLYRARIQWQFHSKNPSPLVDYLASALSSS